MKAIYFEDRSDYEAPRCAPALYCVQEMLAVSPADSENADLDPFIGGGDYEW